MESIRELIEKDAEKFGDKTFLEFNEQTVSFRELNRMSNLVANAFQSEGIHKGDRVSFMLPNRTEFLYLWFGLNKIGGSMVPINTELTPYEVEYQLNHSESKMVVTDRKLLPVVQEACKKASGISKVILLDGEGDSKEWTSYSSFIAGRKESYDRVPIDSGTEAGILYTSGTTGKPKGCIVDQYYYLKIGELYTLEMAVTENDIIMTPLPLFHMNAQTCTVMGSLTSSAKIILDDRFHPATWWKTIREKKVTIFHYLGVVPAMLIDLPETPYDYRPEKVYGYGAGVPRTIHEKFEKRFNVELLEVYGSTEVGAGCPFMIGRRRHKDRKVGTGTFGTPPPYGEAIIADDEDREVPVGTVGELLVRNADPQDRRKGFMKGYYKDPAATEQAWKNGWFHTGDFCVCDKDNYFYFVERKKEMIRRSGENISAMEVEAIINLHPDVEEVAVVPAPDVKRVEEVFAFIVPKNETVKPEDIIAFCEDKLAYFKIPRYIKFIKEIPKTSTQKVRKIVLKDEAKENTADSWDRTLHYKLKREQKNKK